MGRQKFVQNGNLEPGIHSYNIEEFETQFIKEFSNSSTRKNIYNNFRIWVKYLINELKPRYIWLDGSFLTEKLNPNDLDLVIFYRPEDITSPELAQKLKFLIENVSRKYSCDAYVSYCFDHIDTSTIQDIPDSLITNKTYWKGQFGFDRKNQAKGIILIEDPELSKLGGEFQCL